MSDESRYQKLCETARAFVEAYRFASPDGKPNMHLLGSFLSPNFSQSWGHKYMTKDKPELRKVLDKSGFLDHLGTMLPFIESVQPVIHDVVVDEPARKVVAQISFIICPREQDADRKEAVENELVYILTMDETCERIESAREFLDATATARIGELVARARQKQ